MERGVHGPINVGPGAVELPGAPCPSSRLRIKKAQGKLQRLTGVTQSEACLHKFALQVDGIAFLTRTCANL